MIIDVAVRPDKNNSYTYLTHSILNLAPSPDVSSFDLSNSLLMCNEIKTPKQAFYGGRRALLKFFDQFGFRYNRSNVLAQKFIHLRTRGSG